MVFEQHGQEAMLFVTFNVVNVFSVIVQIIHYSGRSRGAALKAKILRPEGPKIWGALTLKLKFTIEYEICRKQK